MIRSTLRALAATGLFLAASVTAVVASAPAAHAEVICDQFASRPIQNGRYIVQNNRWGASTTQCIDVTTSGFTITQANHNNATNGAPASYPSVYLGCHYTNCSTGSNLPMQVSQISTATSSIQYTYVSGATYDAAYDIWLDPQPRTDGQNATEIMIWFNRQGSIQPVGSVVGTTTIGGRTWEVWRGNSGWNVISYVAPSPITSWNFSVLDFINDVRARGAITNSWYLTSIQAGFEPWIGGTGLAVNSFSASVNGGGGNPGGDTQAPTTPGQPTASNVTASGASLAWTASTDNVGVTGYDVLRATGGGIPTVIGTATGTSFNATGLSANTTYTFSVSARDAAGNTSAASPGRTVTTPTGGGGGTGTCTATYRTINAWSGGFQGEVSVRNNGTAALNGWTTTWPVPSGTTIGQVWGGRSSVSGGVITVRNETYNGNLGAGATTTYGFTGTGTAPTPSAVTCTSP
jgi:chitodextrinase